MMGFMGGLESNIILKTLSEGFGNTLKSIGVIIACGAIIGTYLEKTVNQNSLIVKDKCSKLPLKDWLEKLRLLKKQTIFKLLKK